MKKGYKYFKLLIIFSLIAGIFQSFYQNNEMKISAETIEYELYPNPQSIEYLGGDFIIQNEVNVIYEEGIDEYTKQLFTNIASSKGLQIAQVDKVEKGKTNILVGIQGSKGYVDTYAEKNSSIKTAGLFDKTDSYLLSVQDNVITVLGKDTDACYYGLTTFYHVIKQLDSYTIQNFVVEDYADVESRGFIEGYYGNPWSTEDRIALMEWGGNYKLNSYFYAPKDDPKHNSKWKELYTEEEIETKIKPLAEAGNKSKCRFVYALHPYMYNAIRYNSEENYQADLATMQAKFDQVIDAGVRQISILADDAGNVGGDNYIRTLEDMSDWLREKQKEYPDLKITLPFCTQEYMYSGESYYQRFPENVQIVMTGGRVWGEVSSNFTQTFTNNVGRGPYLWINWPCTDNSKKHLIMGGYSTFLHPNVDPSNIQGIVLNPMQQSEPSKVAIFGNACYAWNIWGSNEEADQAWNASFKYVDHNSALETSGSKALREISKHMINQNMDSRVTVLQESVELAPKLTAFKNKLNADTLTIEDVDQMIEEFELLKEASETFNNYAGDTYLRDQMIYWLACWSDTTDATIAYLNGIKAVINNDSTGLFNYQTMGKMAFDKSKTHEFWYVDHNEKAEVGVQHIVPFINTLDSYLATKAESIMDPDIVSKTFITNRSDNPTGSTANVFDGDDSTMVSYRNPVWIYEGDYVGVILGKKIDISYLRFLLGNGKNHMEYAKLQYTEDGKEWKDIDSTEYTAVQGNYQEIILDETDLPANFKAMGIRLIATKDNVKDAYLNVHEITINKTIEPEPEVSGTYSSNRDRMNGSDWSVLNDGNAGSDSAGEVWISKASAPSKDQLPADSYLAYTFSEPQLLKKVSFAQGGSNANDVIKDGVLEYLDSAEEWQTIANVNNSKVQNFDLEAQNITTKSIRIRNVTHVNIWWRVGEFKVETSAIDSSPIEYNVIKTDRWYMYRGPETNLYDGDDNSYVWYDPDGGGNTTNDCFLVDDFLGYDLGKIANLQSTHIVVGADGSDKLMNYTVETSLDGITWTAVNGYESYTGAASGKDILDIELNATKARYIRIRNLAKRASWAKISEFTVKEVPSDGDTKHLYTNTNSSILVNTNTKGEAFLTSGNVLLAQNQYIGIKLDNIKQIENIQTNTLPEGFKLQTSMNALTWKEYTANDDIDACYIRVINTSDTNKVWNIENFKVTYMYIAEKSVTSDFALQESSSDMRNANNVNNVNNVFDGNLSTMGIITGPQDASKKIVFDLGQEIDFTSLRYYVNETQLNYMRSGIFEVSNDPNSTNWTPLMKINEAGVFENVWDGSVAKDAAWLTHDSKNPGYMYAEATKLNAKGRYLRIRPLKTYSHRWLAFNEIQINDGAYITTESNKDVIADAVEERDKIPSNMFDRDFATTYKSSAKNTSFTYRISQPEGLSSMRIVQTGEISNASVAVTYLDGTRANVTLGNLNQAINEFIFDSSKSVVAITVSWDDKVPEIAEIMMSTKSITAADTSQLEAEVAKGAEATWTKDSKTIYEEAKAVAENIIANKNSVSQEVADAALGALKAARLNAKDKAVNISELQAIVDHKLSNADSIYSIATYANYEEAITKLETALQDVDNLSQVQADKLLTAINTAKDALEYSIRNRELAELGLDKFGFVEANKYTKASYEALTNAKSDLEALIAKDKTGVERVHPKDMKEAQKAFDDALDNLVDISALKTVIAEFDTINADNYTEASYGTYKQEIDKGKALLEAGSKEEIATAIQDIQSAKSNLQVKATVDLEAIIKEAEALQAADYTENSYKALATAIADAKKTHNQDEEEALANAILDAKSKLVNIVALKDKVALANTVDKDNYTVSSYKQLENLLNDSKELFISGSEKEISAMVNRIQAALLALEKRASGMEDYRDNIILKPATGYTKESYEEYKKAYDFLMGLDPLQTSEAAFVDAKLAFEKAEAALQLKGSPSTNDATNKMLLLFLLTGSAFMLLEKMRRKNKKSI
ncbi:hyaluronoglucosaminidase [Breznakia sp. PF5-3]|uniref:beta-N-acetylglucosaminidase domain-containing protein n=1 Tax=unclassified Breznakia TaxID=2623764 RepID=UPI0024051E71|nr:MULTISPECIES: beta-N-acetylglucosaminidase domain-containing protein [unclassified Breznakia]MDF9825537.1 hyaluronoglucosaminidase [Breznakia sp. PM6-1]MDF9836022.1 hyaluronoglucosaminidase [Breznakia sp. PF5-3]